MLSDFWAQNHPDNPLFRFPANNLSWFPGYYSGWPFNRVRDEGVASQSGINSVNDLKTVFPHGRDVAPNRTEGFGPGSGAKSARDFLFDLYHANIAFGQVVVNRHKGQGFCFTLMQSVQ
jgi:hypothetical protein